MNKPNYKVIDLTHLCKLPKTIVVHCKKEPFDVYIGRGSKWGNPFVIGKDGTRTEVIEKYKEYLFNNRELYSCIFTELQGKILGCWCSPKACHGDVLAEIANTPPWYVPIGYLTDKSDK